jgi:hypothetical protein
MIIFQKKGMEEAEEDERELGEPVSLCSLTVIVGSQ